MDNMQEQNIKKAKMKIQRVKWKCYKSKTL